MKKILSLFAITILTAATLPADELDKLEHVLLGETPLESDLRYLTDTIGGRPTGSLENLASVDWAVDRLSAAGVKVWKESFTMAELWLENSAQGAITGDVGFGVRLAAMPFSIGTGEQPVEAVLLDGGRGSAEDFVRLGEQAADAFVLVETQPLKDVPGLFTEYIEAAGIERRAIASGARGLVYMGSRPEDVLHRHNAALGIDNEHLLLIMDRVSAKRAMRLLRQGNRLALEVEVDVASAGPYESFNVLAEIPGSDLAHEVVLVGAHLDSWGLGTGALDNGCNVAMLIDIARQMTALKLTPRRTIRFALWNGEEQGLQGSWGYVQRHADKLDRHVMASSYDIGSGRISGFFTGGRPDVAAAVGVAVQDLESPEPLAVIDEPVVGTDNYDFMLEGIANLVANQESANYGPNYHASTDTFDKVDLEQVKRNAVVAATVTWAFANQDFELQRQSPQQVEELIESTSLGEQMKTFHMYHQWQQGLRGRRVEGPQLIKP